MDLQLFFRNGIAVMIIYILFLLISNKTLKRESKSIPIGNQIGACIFCLLFLAIVTITGMTPLSGFHTDLRLTEINWNPFTAIHEMMMCKDFYGYANVFGNIILFMPIGFCFPVLCRKNRSFLKVSLIGFFISLLIEIWQLWLARGTDVMDLLLNTLGAMLGYLCFVIALLLFPKAVNFFSSSKKEFRKLEQAELVAAIILPIAVTIIWGFIDRYRYFHYK